MNFRALAEQYGTPLYLYDFDAIKQDFFELKNAFKARRSILAYAIKANSNLSLLRYFASMDSGADCVSIGEVRRAILAGIPPYKIIFSGVGKRDDEIEEALHRDILFINVESEGELHRIESIAAQRGKPARISIRVNPNIDPQTHPYISTGLSDNKFGVNEENAKRLYLMAHKSPHLEPVGIHFHIGSQLTQLDPIREASQKVAALTKSLLALNIDIKFFDIGGGLGIVYDDETTIRPYDYAQAVLESISGLDVTIICEPGRFLVGSHGYFLTRVLYEKQGETKRFVITDGAMNDLLRPSLYSAFHRVEAVDKEGESTPADVVGPICESGDFLAKNVALPPLEHNDLIVIHSAGAYGMSMSSNYNSRLRPAEVAIVGEKDYLIRHRENFEEMLAEEKACLENLKEVL